MFKKKENRVLTVIHNLLSAKTVPESTNASLDSICQLYEFDRARSFIRVIGTDQFVALDETSYGEEPCVHIEKNGVDFGQSYYRKDGAASHDMMDLLIKEQFIHTREFHKYQEGLESIGFIPSEDKTVMEACLKCVTSTDIGMMGYFVFEKFDTNQKLTENEIFEVKNLCEITNDRIEIFETRKQLRDEEMQNIIDNLTGLPVVRKFKDEVEAMLPFQESYAVIYLDIDKFKYINEIWSHETGNDILVRMAEIIQDTLKETDKCCRVIDDKFAILLKYDTEEALQCYLEVLKQRFVKMQQEYFNDVKITVIGGVYAVRDDRNINLIMDKANIARRSTKGTFESSFIMYNQSLENMSEREKLLEKRLSAALENGEFVPFLQPKFNLFTNEIYGAEALARWKTAEKMISPAEFIPVFEKNGFITRLDFIIYEGVFKFMQESKQKGYTLYPISLNVSRGHMKDEHFIEKFTSLMDRYEIPYDLIELEITESIFVEDKDILKKFIRNIRRENIAVSIDDFGTAYSSLNLLKDIVVDVIKMDKSFIDNINKGEAEDVIAKDKIIIKNIITMINELKFKTIFEGIEMQEQVDFLKEIGCNYGQGFIFARPMSLDEFTKTYLIK